MKRKAFITTLILLMAVTFYPFSTVHADIAPPEMPPGANINPGGEGTQVRMMAETVTLEIQPDPNDATGAIAHTVAQFTMRNLGTTEERMQVRFPLSFFNGNSDGFGNFPEIPNVDVKINGGAVSAQREMQAPLSTEGPSYDERDQVPWTVFDVAFPPGQDVVIEVAYSVKGFGYYPYEAFRYILETGAGWNDTIGTADIIVRFPYDVNEKNLWLSEETTGYSVTTKDAQLSGNEVHWHFENLEPTFENNIEITLVTPALWQKVLTETGNVTLNPNDGEAWGRLGKAYKEIIVMPKGWLRDDTGGREIYELSKQAYERCLEFLPSDPLWHYGYADLLWPHFYYDYYLMGLPDTEGLLPEILGHLKTSLDLDANNQLAKNLLSWISNSVPNSVRVTDFGYDYLALTMTPLPPATLAVATDTPAPTATAVVDVITPTPAAPAGQPLCGSAAFVFPFLFGILWWSKRKVK